MSVHRQTGDSRRARAAGFFRSVRRSPGVSLFVVGEAPRSRPAGQAVAAMGLQVVVPAAQSCEVVEPGGPAVCHRLDVVDLELAADVTARHHTGPVRSSMAVRNRAGMVRPRWQTALMSVPSVSSADR